MSKGSTLSFFDILNNTSWKSFETYLNTLENNISAAIKQSQEIKENYRQELLASNLNILKPSKQVLEQTVRLFKTGTIIASDGSIMAVPLASGAKIQIGIIIVSNRGDMIDIVRIISEPEIIPKSNSASEHMLNLKKIRPISNLLSKAIMLYGEREQLIKRKADWRLIHGELIPYELKTGVGRPSETIPKIIELAQSYIDSKNFMAVIESSERLELLNQGVVLNPGEYLVIDTLEHELKRFLEGDSETGQSAANFSDSDKKHFQELINLVGKQIVMVLVKAGSKPFLIECHKDKIEEAVSVFIADSLWIKGISIDNPGYVVRGFPFHIDLADQIARTLFKGSDFRNIVETKLYELDLESGLFDIDSRRTRK